MDSYSEFLYDRVNLHSGFAVHNGMKITHISKDRVVGEMPITPESLNPLGLVHGGCLAALADSVAGTAVYVHGRVCVTLNCSFNYLRPAYTTLFRSGLHHRRVRRGPHRRPGSGGGQRLLHLLPQGGVRAGLSAPGVRERARPGPCIKTMRPCRSRGAFLFSGRKSDLSGPAA